MTGFKRGRIKKLASVQSNGPMMMARRSGKPGKAGSNSRHSNAAQRAAADAGSIGITPGRN
jgi:hypothetical protein